MSTFGRVFRVTTFGESHCASVGCIIDGVPPGLSLTESDVQVQLTRRRPGQSRLTTPRDELDLVKIHSGTERGLTLGTPIMMNVENLNVKPGDYKEINEIPRPGHADMAYQLKYGLGASSGGGRASARETIGRVAAGAVAEKFLSQEFGTTIVGFVTSVGDVELPLDLQQMAWTRQEVDELGTLRLVRGTSANSTWKKSVSNKDVDASDEACFLLDEQGTYAAYCNRQATQFYTRTGEMLPRSFQVDAQCISDELVSVRCPHMETSCRIATLIRVVKSEEDSIGGTVGLVCNNVPPALGEPVFDKLEALMAHGMMSLPATKGFEMGLGFRCTKLRGSQHNDPFENTPQGIRPKTNNAGGTLGGISSGAPLVMRVAVKPVSTIGKPQQTVDFMGVSKTLEAKGRHDPCVLPRTPPLVEAMAALVLADMVLMQRTRVLPMHSADSSHSDKKMRPTL